ncbi:hypothetical protein GCM10018987_30450 [Streptomyces cremeus]
MRARTSPVERVYPDGVGMPSDICTPWAPDIRHGCAAASAASGEPGGPSGRACGCVRTFVIPLARCVPAGPAEARPESPSGVPAEVTTAMPRAAAAVRVSARREGLRRPGGRSSRVGRGSPDMPGRGRGCCMGIAFRSMQPCPFRPGQS